VRCQRRAQSGTWALERERSRASASAGRWASRKTENSALQAVPEDQALALPCGGLGHVGGVRATGVVLGDRQGREVGERAGAFDRHVHVGGLVLDGLEGAQRPAELHPLLHVREGEVEDAATGADRSGREAGEGQIRYPCDECALSFDMGHMQVGVEDGDPFGGQVGAAYDSDAVRGEQRDLVGAVGVEDVTAGAVEHRGAAALGEAAGQRGEPGGGGQERRRVGDVAELLQDQGEFERGCLQPAEPQIGVPLLVLGPPAHLGDRLTHRTP